jgi:TetR/AcrR family transcriptional regulator, fatty acid metabolism regulator protein
MESPVPTSSPPHSTPSYGSRIALSSRAGVRVGKRGTSQAPKSERFSEKPKAIYGIFRQLLDTAAPVGDPLNEDSFRVSSVIPPFADRALEKREKILRAAVTVFAERGYFHARVTDVAKAAGVADGTIYLYFKSKEDLLIQVFGEGMERFLAALRREISDVADAREKLRRIIEFHLATIGRDRDLAVVVQVELRHSLKFMSLFTHQGLADYLNVLRETVEEGQAAGLFRQAIHPQMAAKAIFGVLDEMVTSWVLSEKRTRLEGSASQVAMLLLEGLTKPCGGSSEKE